MAHDMAHDLPHDGAHEAHYPGGALRWIQTPTTKTSG